MNLRFENDTLRFRVNARELDQLLANASLTGATTLPSGAFRYAIELIDGEHWDLTGDLRQLKLRLPRLDVLGHKASLPSKDGIARTIAANGGVLEVCFEVDVKKAKPAS
jgi:hypothetical protein